VCIAARPTDNAANEALVAFISQTLEVPRRNVRLCGGTRGRWKTLEISGVEAARIERLYRAESEE
jgi:uncharacterized protein YggU (UPF0235/DUF167 family)